MPFLPQESYPCDFGLTKLVESVCPVQRIHDQIFALLLSQPVIERRFRPGGGSLQVLP